MLLKEISYQGQLKIVKSKIALIGSGGIGCPLAMYLAGAGVGTLGLFDSDTV
jgi:adenylyltransferase/sulfurtransferase